MRTLRRTHPGWFELALFGTAYLIYFSVRALTQGDVARALANAADIVHVERKLDLDWEAAAQGIVSGRHVLVDTANAVYLWGHWPLLIVGGILLYHLGGREYRRLRNVVLISGALGLAVFALFPVAPPRLAAFGLNDTGAYRALLPAGFINEYAAMPSFHAGWNLLLGIELFRVSRRVLVRGFALVMPLTMAFVVIATANHYVLDVFGGAIVVVAALALVSLLEPRRRHAPTEDRIRPPGGHGRSPMRPLRLSGTVGDEGGDLMTTFQKDLAATVATALAVLAYVATHEGWSVWLIGDSVPWATAVISLLGLVVFALERTDRPAFTQIGMLAGLFAILAFMSGSLTPLSLLVVTIVALWIVSVARDAWHGTHHPTTA